MKFADYFKEAIEYGESLGLRHEPGNDEWRITLTEPDEITCEGKTFYPNFLTIWDNLGLDIESLSPVDEQIIKPAQQIKLAKMFVDGYERYLQDQEVQDEKAKNRTI